MTFKELMGAGFMLAVTLLACKMVEIYYEEV